MAKASHPSNIEVVHHNRKWIAQVHESIVNKTSTCKEPITWIFRVTLNALK